MTTHAKPIKAEEWLGEIGRRIDGLADRTGIDRFAGDVQSWKGRLEELRVQAALGSMEVRDRVAPLLARIEGAVSDVERLLDDLGQAEIVDEEGLTKEIRGAMATLAAEIESANELR